MHVHQPCPIDLLEIDPFKKVSKEWMLIAAGNEEKANAMTASWGGFGTLWDRSVCFIFVRESRYTKEFLDREKGFSLSFFENDKNNRQMLKYFGSVSGRNEDKMANAKLHFSFLNTVPYINEGNLILICKKLSAVPIEKENIIVPLMDQMFYEKGDYHTMYIGEILQVLAR